MATEYRRDSVYKSTEIQDNTYLGIWEPTVAEIKNISTNNHT